MDGCKGKKATYEALVDVMLRDFRHQLLEAYETVGVPEPNESDSCELPIRGPSSSEISASGRSRASSPGAFQKTDQRHAHSVSHTFSTTHIDKLHGSPGDDDGASGNQMLTSATSSPSEHGISTGVLRSGLKGLSDGESREIRHRLRIRLGALSSKRLVSGKSLHDAVAVLGLTRYTEDDMNMFVNLLADFIKLEFHAPDPDKEGDLIEDEDDHDSQWNTEEWAHYGKSVWEWPADFEKPQSVRSGKVHRSMTTMAGLVEVKATRTYNVVPAQALVDIFLAQEGTSHKMIFGAKLMPMYRAMKEILVAGETNRLVAELTFVRINDLAVPVERMNALMYMEPLVAILIVANGIMIGFQTDPAYEGWEWWTYIELVFALFLMLEIAVRMRILRCRRYWCGPDRYWNWFDVVLAAAGIADLILQFASKSQNGVAGTSLLRFCRLIRLVRIVKVFRIKAMKDLRLMVKGLVAGIRTLMLAFSLLFGVLYVISGFATITIGLSEHAAKHDLEKFFRNIPASMFTAFRCFTGECVNDAGQPIHALLAADMGLPFILGYVASYMLVSMGIFNVILAVYVDITMKAAKENDAVTAEQHSRESVRVARTTRELLKKFASAYHVFSEERGRRTSKAQVNMEKRSRGMFTQDFDHASIAITKDIFLLVIQDRSVQKLMDDLDLPPDRANLFEIIDADGSGTLQITELLHGLLKMRGEINKSDTVATYLATKALQDMITEMKEANEKRMDQLAREVSLDLQALRLRTTVGAAQASEEHDNLELSDSDGMRSPMFPALPLPIKPEAAEECESLPCWAELAKAHSALE